MRIRAFIVLGFASLAAAGLAVVACGGEEEDPTPGPSTEDAGKDGSTPTADSGSDSGGPTDDCDKSKDFLADIPDAAIADGASSSGICLGCLRSHCNAALELCNADCECRGFVGATVGCVAQGTDSFLNCATAAAAENGAPSESVQGIGLGIYQCANQNCKAECALDDLFPPDAGGSDGGSDAGEDAGGDAGDASN